MKNKAIISLTTLLLATNIGSFMYYDKKLSKEERIVINLRKNIDKKSDEIIELGDVIRSKNKEINNDNKVIKSQNDMLNKQNKQIKEKDEKIKELQYKINSMQQQQQERQQQKQQQVTQQSQTTQQNFRHEEKGSDVVGSRKINVIATAYVAHCTEGCTGTTATGVDVSDTIYYKGVRVIAVDTNLIKLNSLVRVDTENQSFTAMAIDRGGGIVGNRIDVLVGSKEEAVNFGRQQATVTVLREGE